MKGESCNPSPECKYFNTGCFEDKDHFYFPKKDYQTSIEKRFRRLPENIIEGCRRVHDERHMTTPPPEKPSRDAMLRAIGDSALNLIKGEQTNETDTNSI